MGGVEGEGPKRGKFATPLLLSNESRSPTDLQSLLSVKQVAKKLGVCTRTVYELVERGALPHIRVLNAIRVAPSDLAAFVAAQHVGGRSPER